MWVLPETKWPIYWQKKGVDGPQPKLNTDISLGHLKRLDRQEVVTIWRGLWRFHEEKEEQGRLAQGMGRTYRLISRDPLPFTLRPNPVVTSFSKKTVSAYIPLKTGKGLLKSFQCTSYAP